MRPRDIIEYRRQEPFRPFRVHVSDGSSYEVRQQWGTMVVARQTVFIGVDPDADGIPGRMMQVDAKAITRLEPIVESAGGGSRS